MEVWKPVKGYEGIYEISKCGQFKSLSREKFCGHKGSKAHITKERILATHLDRAGYPRVRLNKDGVSKTLLIHRQLAINFIDNPKSKEEINHIDGIKTNNSLENLEWTTRKKNMQHASEMGFMEGRKGEVNHLSKLTDEKVKDIRMLYNEFGYTQKQLSENYNVTVQNIHCIIKRKTWKHI